MIRIGKARDIIRTYREYGHTKANINPLGSIAEIKDGHHVDLPSVSLLDANSADLDIVINIHGMEMSGLEELESSNFSLREVIAVCERVYCGRIGIELSHVSDQEKRAWLCAEAKNMSLDGMYSGALKQDILDDLARGTMLERFLASKFPNEKRFGLDGLETLVPGLCSLVDHSADAHGVQRIILSQCHRGRLNIFSSVFQKSPDWLFRQFAGNYEPYVKNGHSGDVKYHYGMEGRRKTSDGNSIRVEVLPNPSHLEATGPVAQGKTRAAQNKNLEVGPLSIMPIALYTDGAISGQGSVYEVLNMSRLEGYEVGGTVRITVNNQIGFTTDPSSARSTRYCTDILKYIEAPILHINSEDPEAVFSAFKLAANWRAKFKSDIMIDFVCYRRFGHNEIDQARFTQPEMYEAISNKIPVLEAYGEKLLHESMTDPDFLELRKQHHWNELEKIFEQSQKLLEFPVNLSERPSEPAPTVVDEETLGDIMECITTVPDTFTPHRTLTRILRGKKQDFDAGNVDWSTAEALAFGTLLKEGFSVRLSGEDVERGTFSQRHSVLHDQATYRKWTPLNNLGSRQAAYTAFNSPLSEFGVLGFDFGYSLGAQDSLTIWEAQFGDFVNNAQVIVDQLIASGEAKWGLQSNLVLSLPHGYDGQGPEHSAARIGRFLELCNESSDLSLEEGLQQWNCNMRVVFPTTPANLFHALRRQVHSPHKKPLALFFSKSLLRHPLGRSRVHDLAGSTAFQPVIDDPQYTTATGPIPAVDKVIFCSGQVFATLHEHRYKHSMKKTAIVRIEELHPFPKQHVQRIMDRYMEAGDIVWCQEEPYNSGAWYYMQDRLGQILSLIEGQRPRKLRYAGRPSAAAVATGSKQVHAKEEADLVSEAFRAT